MNLLEMTQRFIQPNLDWPEDAGNPVPAAAHSTFRKDQYAHVVCGPGDVDHRHGDGAFHRPVRAANVGAHGRQVCLVHFGLVHLSHTGCSALAPAVERASTGLGDDCRFCICHADVLGNQPALRSSSIGHVRRCHRPQPPLRAGYPARTVCLCRERGAGRAGATAGDADG